MAVATTPSPAGAGVFTDDLSRCLVRATTAEDRAALVRWVFLTFAANPAFVDLVSVTEGEREQGIRSAARVYDRLLLIACRQETLQAWRAEGALAIEHGFEAIGNVAARELMGSPQSVAAVAELTTFMDMAALEVLAREAGVAAAEPPAQP